jgi:hypothetical protein
MAVSAARFPDLDQRGKFDAPIIPTDTLEVRFDGESKRVLAGVSLSIKAEDANGKLVEITAVYRVVYQVNDSFQGDLLAERAEAFCRSHSLAHVWPYWRELLAGLSVKMGLPTILAPLLLVGSSASVRPSGAVKDESKPH